MELGLRSQPGEETVGNNKFPKETEKAQKSGGWGPLEKGVSGRVCRGADIALLAADD